MLCSPHTIAPFVAMRAIPRRGPVASASSCAQSSVTPSIMITSVENHPYRGGRFTGALRNGKPWEGEVEDADIIYKRVSGPVTDGALAASGVSRLQGAGRTPFQKLLLQDKSPFQRGQGDAEFTESDEWLRRTVLNYDMVYLPLDAAGKHEVNNDGQRRLFDTLFAKELLTRVIRQHGAVLRRCSDGLLDFYRDDLLIESFGEWQAASEGRYGGNDGRLQQLNIQVNRAQQAVATLALNDEEKQLCLDLYLRRYLNYLVDETEAYKGDHPKGIIKSKSNPLYFKRGRLDGEFAVRDSLSMGILRNLDACPTDLRFESHPSKREGVAEGMYTRCPDRLHMADPDSEVDQDPDSWLSYNFLSGNTPYVNGLSGSMLVEIGGLVYARLKMRKGGAMDNPAARATLEEVDPYFRALAAMYVYIDGGHSLFEIQSSFRQTWVGPSLVRAFEDASWARLGQDLYGDCQAFRAAWTQTQQVARTLANRAVVHAQLVQPKALAQTVAARGLLHAPNLVLEAEMSAAANTLQQVLKGLDAHARNALCAHLTAPGRLLSGQQAGSVCQAVERVAQGSSARSCASAATDRAVLIALMGDIGGIFTTPRNASESLHQKLRQSLLEAGLHVPCEVAIDELRRAGGAAAVGPRKHLERSIIPLPEGKSRPSRAGVGNTGDAADTVLGIPSNARIPPNRWVEFRIDPQRLTDLNEPMVGHMSASPAEILQAWDMLRGEPVALQYLYSGLGPQADAMDQHGQALAAVIDPVVRRTRLARAAGSAAFLLGLGYHSAVEVIEGILFYTGQTLRQGALANSMEDATDIFGQGAATELVIELLESHVA